MALESATEVLAKISKPRKAFPKQKQVKQEIIVVSGSTKWSDRKKMKAILSQFKPKDVQYLITGTSKGAELLAVSVAKELKMTVVQVHPDQSLGGNAIHIRNEGVFKFFKPTQVIGFHADIASSVSTAIYLKLGKRKGIPCQLIDGKIPPKKKAVK